MNGFIKMVISLEDSSVLIGSITQTVKHEIKNQWCWFLLAFLAPLVTSIVQPVISSVVKGISGRGVKIAETGYIDNIF